MTLHLRLSTDLRSEVAMVQLSPCTMITVSFPLAVLLKNTAWLTLHCENLSGPTRISTSFWYHLQPLCFKLYRVLTGWHTWLGYSVETNLGGWCM